MVAERAYYQAQTKAICEEAFLEKLAVYFQLNLHLAQRGKV